MTNTNEKFVNELIETVRTAQQERYTKRHEAIVAANPWLLQVRNIQKMLNEKEAK